MRITVETEREAYRVGDLQGPMALRVSVKVDGEEELSLSQALCEAELRSHFDILWEDMGMRIKKAFADAEKEKALT